MTSSSEITRASIEESSTGNDENTDMPKTPTNQQTPTCTTPTNQQTPICTARCLTWLFSLCLGLILLLCVIGNKLSMILLSEHMANATPDNAVKIFVMIQLTVVVPHVFNFIRGIKEVLIWSHLPWPTRPALAWGIVVSLVESVGVGLFAFRISAVTTPGYCVILMSLVFLCPTVNTLWNVRPLSGRNQHDKSHRTEFCLHVVSFLLQIGGLVATYIVMHKPDNYWISFVAIFSISIAWVPYIQTHLLGLKDDAEVFKQQQPGPANRAAEVPSPLSPPKDLDNGDTTHDDTTKVEAVVNLDNPTQDDTTKAEVHVNLDKPTHDDTTKAEVHVNLDKPTHDDTTKVEAVVNLDNPTQDDTTKVKAVVNLDNPTQDDTTKVKAVVNLDNPTQDDTTKVKAVVNLDNPTQDDTTKVKAVVNLDNPTQDDTTKAEVHVNLDKPTHDDTTKAEVHVNLDKPTHDDTTKKRDIKQQEESPKKKYKHNHAVWKLTIWMSCWKAIFSIGLSFVIFRFETNLNIKNYWDGWKGLKESDEFYYFVGNLLSSCIGYYVGFIACKMCLQRWGFFLPLFLSTPLAYGMLYNRDVCHKIVDSEEICDHTYVVQIIVVTLMVAAQTFSTGWIHFHTTSVVMLRENQLFWTPMYCTGLLEQWLMLARRTDIHDDKYNEVLKEKLSNSRIIICTTMFREEPDEMKQLLESIWDMHLAPSNSNKNCECHVFFDDGVRDTNLTEFALQLVDQVETVLGTQGALAMSCTKKNTPYGMSLEWVLHESPTQRKTNFTIHLKDNTKVKKRKRWSQVMYMKYVLDYMSKTEAEHPKEWFILTTDADVKFTHDSVEALLDLMTRDETVGAVSARTHPLGHGPLIWYQIFEYAIGHWFQKAAEHVIGSVLCAPGCYSMYRCSAIEKVLPEYQSNVECAFDFLTKDMGEDRWLCTLLVQRGWKIEYCAASKNSTQCPSGFEEFFKQRRRWIVSTLANLILLIKEWAIVTKLNHRVSTVFLLYQCIIFFTTIIGPGSVILVISGGVQYATGVNAGISVAVQVLVSIVYATICLKTSSNTQMTAGKVLTFLYALMMTVVLVGTAVSIRQDFNGDNERTGNFISDDIKVSTTTAYLGAIAGIFVVTGLLHLKECFILGYGIVFLICMPAGYIILVIYSVCNMTDRSWGTREENIHSEDDNGHLGENRFCQIKQDLENLPLKELEEDQKAFWEKLKNDCLIPQPQNLYCTEENLKAELTSLRTQWLVMFGVSNSLWIVLISVLAAQGKLLSVVGSNPVGLAVLLLFSFVLLIQFFAMLLHRLTTLQHVIARNVGKRDLIKESYIWIKEHNPCSQISSRSPCHDSEDPENREQNSDSANSERSRTTSSINQSCTGSSNVV